MKRILSIILIFVAVGLFGCGGSKAVKPNYTGDTAFYTAIDARMQQHIQANQAQITEAINQDIDAAGRIAFWVKYYIYKRPHQGIGGLCPADRFFEINTALKKTLEKGVEENALELALRGEPREPFYMVGRMGGQSVVIRAEKGKVKMQLDDEKELVYDTGKDHNNESQANPQGVQPQREGSSRIVHLEERKSVTQTCREMSVSWALLDRWQNQAMEAMLNALSPKRPENAEGLSPRLQRLIDKKLPDGSLVKLERRLKTIQRKAK
jgi:hypothetical protein